jgi:hypothetical protein
MELGMFFGQGFSTDIGANTLTYYITDGDTSSAVPSGTFSVRVNQMPYITTTGSSASLA